MLMIRMKNSWSVASVAGPLFVLITFLVFGAGLSHFQTLRNIAECKML